MITIYTYNGNVVKDSTTGKWFTKPSGPGPGPGPDPYNPLGLPPNTVRVRTSDGNEPVKGKYTTYETSTLVPGTTDVYDVYRSGTTFKGLLRNSSNLVEVLGANTTGITEMWNMFFNSSNLTSVSLFDTSSVTNTKQMFAGCRALTTVPLFDTSNVTDVSSMFKSCSSLSVIPLFNTYSVTIMDDMFFECHEVQSGALALYQQASSQANPPSSHQLTFYQCGDNTQTGAAELGQIAWDWQ